VLLKQDPPDVDRAYLERAQRYQSESRGSPHSRESDSEWDAFLAASTRNGRLGSELKGDVRDAYQRYVRLVGQMAGEEGALDSAAGVLYDLLRGAARGAQGERRDVHGFDYGMQRLSLLVVPNSSGYYSTASMMRTGPPPRRWWRSSPSGPLA
jgi:hypothetical protein